MGISDKIEAFIIELLKEEQENEWLELRRNELASVFDCVPSQINYVISTRFTPQKGYVVESKRGGGGYIRIRRISNVSAKLIQTAGRTLSSGDAKEYVSRLKSSGEADDKSARLMLAAMSFETTNKTDGELRAEIFKNMLKALS